MERLVKNILLIDDDYPTNLLNRTIIEKQKIVDKVVDVNSAKKALDYLDAPENNLPDLILLDINMPVMNGWEFLETLESKNNPRFDTLVILMLSASNNPDDIERSKKHKHVKDFLSKPLRINELADKINGNLEGC